MATTTEQIVIRGDLVQIETVSVSRSMPLADLIPLIAVPPPITFPRLPMGTRYAHMDPSAQKMTLLVEVGPRLQSMRTSRHATTFRLTMPYQYYAFTAQAQNFGSDLNWRLENWYLFWAREPITGPHSGVIPALLPNIYQDRGVICFGSTQPNSNQTISQRIDQIVNEFDVTTFNGDLGWNRPSAYRSFAHWAAESATNPLGWRNWPEWARLRPLADMLPAATTVIRPTDVQVEGVIPEIRTGWTFGRAHEWLLALSAVDRYRLIRALASDPSLTVRLPSFDPDDYPTDAEAGVAEEPAPATEPPGPVAVTDEVGTEPITFDEAQDILDADERLAAQRRIAEAAATNPEARTREQTDALVAEGLAVYDRVVATEHARRQATLLLDADAQAEVATAEPRCACQDRNCACERVVLTWDATCAACLNGRHQYP